MAFSKESECSQEIEIGYAPLSYFIVGIIEVLFSAFLAIVLFKRNYFPTLSRSEYFSYILPIYVSLVVPLLGLCFVIGVHAIIGIFVTNKFLLVLKWFVLRACCESLSLFFMNVGIGFSSARISVLRGMMWAGINCLAVIVAFIALGFDAMIIATLVVVGELIVFYSSLLVIPLEMLHRRPALYKYATLNLCLLIYQLGAVIAYLTLPDTVTDACSVEMNYSISEFLQVVTILYAFFEDSKFWQGFHSDSRSNLNQPLLGIWDMNNEAVNLVADSVLQLERKVVNIIPFSQLRVDTSMYFSGGTARVYKGSFQQHEVAIKFLFCIELTPGRILEFCKEASMLDSLKHPNIVTCYGVAIMPPAISLVTEYCTYGSLFDFLHSTDLIVNDSHEGEAGRTASKAARARTETGETVDSARSDRRKIIQSASKAFKGMTLFTSPSRDSGDSRSIHDIEEGNEDSDYSFREGDSIGAPITSPLVQVANNSVTFKTPQPGRKYLESISSRESGSQGIRRSSNTGPETTDVATKLANALGEQSANNSSQHVSYFASSESVRSSVYLSRKLQGSMPWHAMSISHKLKGGEPASQVSLKLKSPASVMLTREMGFGLGPMNALSRARANSESKSRRKFEISLNMSNSSLLLSGGISSIHSIGVLLPMSIRLQMIRDCSAGLAYLHSRGIMHCDIKSLNFLGTNLFCLFMNFTFI